VWLLLSFVDFRSQREAFGEGGALWPWQRFLGECESLAALRPALSLHCAHPFEPATNASFSVPTPLGQRAVDPEPQFEQDDALQRPPDS